MIHFTLDKAPSNLNTSSHCQSSMGGRLRLWLVAAVALLGAYLSASGLLRLNEVFFQPLEAPQRAPDAAVSQARPPPPAFDRLVVVLIDALRADMVLGSGAIRPADAQQGLHQPKTELNEHMPYTRSLVASGAALAYIGHASVPTVTMPRLKALLTGRTPSFIDILKNFNSAALEDGENLIARLQAAGKRIVFYGDDTWLKLFPEAFERADGTSGFFTRDTVEVDDNVTRHLKHELDPEMNDAESNDWDVLVLHYLGLDHVGHLRGPRSPLMVQKLSEMDDIVKRIHRSVQAQDERRKLKNSEAGASLVLLCSDHGMSEVGNHGGATLEESSALLMFLRGDGEDMQQADDYVQNEITQQRRKQVDLVPTISTLFGLQIPVFSTGVILAEVVHSSTKTTANGFARAVYANFQQLRKLGDIKLHASSFGEFDRRYATAIQRLSNILATNEEVLDKEHVDIVVATVLKASRELQATLAQSDGSEYDLRLIGSGVVLLLVASIAALVCVRITLKSHSESNSPSSQGNMFPAIIALGGSAIQIISLSSSSSIENEHATAFFFMTTLLVALAVQLFRKGVGARTVCTQAIALFILLVLLRTMRSRNQVINFGRLNGLTVDSNIQGNEFANDDSLSILSTAPLVPIDAVSPAWWVGCIGIAITMKSIRLSYSRKSRVSLASAALVIFWLGIVAVICTKIVDNDASGLQSDFGSWDADACARAVYALSAVLAFLYLKSAVSNDDGNPGRTTADLAVWLLVTLVQRDSHLPTLFLIAVFLFVVTWWLEATKSTRGASGDVFVTAALGTWLAEATFFALGNSHLVTTIDISQSNLGLSGYSQAIVGLLTFVSTFSGPLVCFSSVGLWTSGSPKQPRGVASAIVAYQVIRFMVYTYVACASVKPVCVNLTERFFWQGCRLPDAISPVYLECVCAKGTESERLSN